jgi:sugar phosphate isomerase/epimerase
MRLGTPVFGPDGDPDHWTADPDAWIAALRRHGYRAAYWPQSLVDDEDRIRAHVRAAEAADIVIAEVGVFNNPLDRDDEARRQAISFAQERLALADKIGARCCVNLAGSRNRKDWWGPDADNYSDETFDLIVETVREIIDAVKPSRTYYTLEPMPWLYPDSADSYLELIGAVARKQFAVHLDVVNLINSPQRFFNDAALIRECFDKLGPYIRSCHAKDICIIAEDLPLHLQEVRPGLGQLDYHTYLRELDRRDPDLPLMVEHLSTEEEYRMAADYIRSVAKECGITMK